MKRCLHCVLCLLAAVHLLGGHWGVLQMVAWAKMVQDYSGERGLIAGVKQAFDGEHPCEMCRKIATDKGREEQERAPFTKGVQENLFKWLRLSPTRVVPEPSWRESRDVACLGQPVVHYVPWVGQPPVPPPKLAV